MMLRFRLSCPCADATPDSEVLWTSFADDVEPVPTMKQRHRVWMAR